MKPTTLCLSVLIVAFLLATEVPRVHGMGIALTHQLLRLVAKELKHLMRVAGTGTNQLDRPTMQQTVIITLNNQKVIEKDGSESDESQTLMDTDISQKADVTGEDKQAASKVRELIEKVGKWIKGLNPLHRT